jgi:ribonuclease HII
MTSRMAADYSGLGALMAESYRLRLMRGLEQLLADGGYRLIAGVDEVGRGCLAGPVVAAAVIVDPSCWIPGVDDSKRLPADRRERISRAIRKQAIAIAVATVPASTIDRINILQATRLAMTDALRSLHIAPDLAVIDAVPLAGLPFPTVPIHRGDSFSFAVACASIVAKTERDRMMAEYHLQYPDYGFASNKGYGAKAHRDALVEFGPTPIHRLTFRSVLPRQGTGEEVLDESRYGGLEETSP